MPNNIASDYKLSINKQVDQWKDKQFNIINQEISYLDEYRDTMDQIKKQCKKLLNNNRLSLDEREDKILAMTEEVFYEREFVKYQHDENEVINVIKNVAECIDVEFNQEINPSNLRSFIHINHYENNTINIPQFILKKPRPNFVKRGYKVKLKWNMENDVKPNEKYMSFWYKKNDSHSWQKCIDYKLNVNKNTVCLSEIYSFDNTYSFKIKYSVSRPLITNISSNVQRCSFSKPQQDGISRISSLIDNKSTRSTVNNDLDTTPLSKTLSFIGLNKNNASQKLKLTYHSHFGHFGHNHPKNLLIHKKNKNDKVFYSSINNSEFDDDDDWIIFKFDKKFIPTKFFIKNNGFKSDVKTMRVNIGNCKFNKWEKSFDINIECRKRKQTFDISGIGEKSKHNHVKIILIENHGQAHPDKPRFVVDQFGLYGINRQYALF